MNLESLVPHGHCLVCAKLLPVEQQDAGGKYCSRACEHAMTLCGPEKDGVCLVCGEFIPVERWKMHFPITCSDACAYHQARLASLANGRKKGARVHTCPTCGNPVKHRGAYCSPQCRPLNPNAGATGAYFTYIDFDGWTPTEKEWDAMYEGLIRRGILDLHYEVEQVMADASTLHGCRDYMELSKLHTDGPSGMAALRNLGMKRR